MNANRVPAGPMPEEDRKLGLVQMAFVLAISFVFLGWLYVLLIGVTEPIKATRLK